MSRPSRRFPSVLVWAAFLACIGALTISPIENNDVFIHLKTGEYVLQHAWVPIHDPYSFTASDRDYVAHEWLAGVLFYLVHAGFGVSGLIFFKAAIVAAAYALLLDAARRAGASFGIALLTLVPVLYLSSARWIERPHVFSYLMAAVYLWLFFRYREGRDVRWLCLLVPADILWTNLHGGFVVGIAMLALLAATETALHFRQGAVRLPRHLVVLLLIPPACVVASLANPYGARALTFPFELTSLGLFMQRVYEWQPPFHPGYNRSTMFALYVLYVAALFVTFFLRWRDRSGLGRLVGSLATVVTIVLAATVFCLEILSRGYEPAVLAGILYALLAVFCLFTIVEVGSVDLTQAGLVAFFYLLSLRHNRAVTDAALGTFPVLATNLTALLHRRQPGVERRALAAGVGALVLVAAATFAWGYPYDFEGTRKRVGLAVAGNLPVCAVDFLAREGITGNAFVSYSDAALVIGRLFPAVRVNIDSRNDVYGEDLYREYLGSLSSPEAMEAYLARHRIDFFLLPYELRDARIFDPLEASGRYAPVYYDDAWSVLVRRTPENDAWIRREEFRALRPFADAGPERADAGAALLLEESDRAIRDCPTALVGRLRKSEALRALGRPQDAIAPALAALERDPGNVLASSYLAAAYAAAGQKERAIDLLQSVVAANPGASPARELLQRLRGR